MGQNPGDCGGKVRTHGTLVPMRWPTLYQTLPFFVPSGSQRLFSKHGTGGGSVAKWQSC